MKDVLPALTGTRRLCFTSQLQKALDSRSTRIVRWMSCAILVIRRDQLAVCFAPRALRRPVLLSTMPVPLRKSRARHERASTMCRDKRRPSVCGSAAGRSATASFREMLLSALRSTLPACRPQTEASSILVGFRSGSANPFLRTTFARSGFAALGPGRICSFEGVHTANQCFYLLLDLSQFGLNCLRC